MASQAFDGLLAGLEEARDLQRANPTPAGGISAKPRVAMAINRACVVMLSGHLEKYLYAVTEEAVEIINTAAFLSNYIPERMKLQHAQQPIDDLSKTQWDNRSEQLRAYSEAHAWLWVPGVAGTLDHTKLLGWIKSPKTKQIKRLFRLWGIENVFDEITRTPTNRTRLILKLDELVEKRNNIAHGDRQAVTTPKDLTEYRNVVGTFCGRADRRFARHLRTALGLACNWY